MQRSIRERRAGRKVHVIFPALMASPKRPGSDNPGSNFVPGSGDAQDAEDSLATGQQDPVPESAVGGPADEPANDGSTAFVRIDAPGLARRKPEAAPPPPRRRRRAKPLRSSSPMRSRPPPRRRPGA